MSQSDTDKQDSALVSGAGSSTSPMPGRSAHVPVGGQQEPGGRGFPAQSGQGTVGRAQSMSSSRPPARLCSS